LFLKTNRRTFQTRLSISLSPTPEGVGEREMLQAGKRKRLNRVPWNREDVYDIWFLVHNTAGFITQLQKLRSMSMCEPFEVKLDGMRAEQKREMEYLQKTFWLTSVYDIFVWKLCYGIVPYFEKTIQGTAHRIPVVPEITQGTLLVYEDRDRTKVSLEDRPSRVADGWSCKMELFLLKRL
jgi:hypothetical protein